MREARNGIHPRGFKKDGTPRWAFRLEGKEVSGFKSEREAMTARATEEAHIELHGSPSWAKPAPTAAAEPSTLLAVLGRYDAQGNRARDTSSMVAIKRFLPAELLANDVNAEVLLAFRAKRLAERKPKAKDKATGEETRKPVTDNTVNRDVAYIRRALNWAEIQDPPLLTKNFFKSAAYKANLKGGKNTKKVLTKEKADKVPRFQPGEFERIASFLTPAHRTMAQIAMGTGMRRNEIYDLRSDALDDLGIHLTDTKTDTPRNVYPAAEIMTLVRDAEREYGNGEHVFGKARSAHRKGNEVSTAWTQAAKKAGSASNFHWTRHEWASRFLEEGGTPVELMEAGGWTSLAMVVRYANAATKRIRDVNARVSKSVFGISLGNASEGQKDAQTA